MSFLTAIRLPLPPTSLAFCLLQSDSLTVTAGNCPWHCALTCWGASQLHTRADVTAPPSWHCKKPCSVQQTALLPLLNWTYLMKMMQDLIPETGSRIFVAGSKINGIEIMTCFINWMGTSPCPSELSPAFSLHLHKTWQFCSWEQGPFESNNPFVPC